MAAWLAELIGNRTRIVALAQFICAGIALWGFQADPASVAAVLTVLGPLLMAGMRQITTTPPGRKKP